MLTIRAIEGLQEQRGEGAKLEERHCRGEVRNDLGKEIMSKRRQKNKELFREDVSGKKE